MRLAGTVDVDALFHGNITTLELFRKALKMNNLVYDDLSGEIWLPKTARYETIHESDLSTIMRVDTFSALVSKAAKAPQKNRILIEQALAHYGTRLEELFRENGINLDQFQYEKKKARRR
ncbi:MAG: hypothetical protein J5J00_17070 [Deltaproteobacteria bacterium]|nr:hypothetical protein [Deltaproteobacteria bacterium]